MPSAEYAVERAGLDGPDVGGDGLNEVAVVADEDDRAVEVAKDILHDFGGRDVEMIGRLVEDEEIGALNDEACQRDPRALTAGYLVDSLVHVVAR